MPATADFLAEHPFAAPDIVEPPQAPIYRYRPDINDLVELKAYITDGLAGGSRIDILVANLLQTYVLQLGAPTGGILEVVPDDYNASTNNVFWLLVASGDTTFTGIGALTFADIGGTISVDQLPAGSIGTLNSIDEDALYFYDNTTLLPRLIGEVEAKAFLGLTALTFADIGGIISVDQLPGGTAATVDSIGENAIYFFDELTGIPRLINASDAADFVGLSALTFADIDGFIGLSQLPADTVVTIDSIDEDALYFFDDTTFLPKLLGKTDAQTFLEITPGGGSFLSNNTARVDPSGDDSTGTIGDLAKPFLTIQGACDQAEIESVLELILYVEGANGVYSGESITTALPQITFIGIGGFNTLFGSLTFTGASAQLGLTNAFVGDLIATNASDFTIIGYNAETGNITNSHSGGNLFVQGDAGRNIVGNITATGPLVAYGLNWVGTVSAPGQTIHISGALSVFDDGSALTLDSAGSEVWVTGSIIKQVTACDILHLSDSRVIGTNNATSTVYADVLLLPRYQMSVDFDATGGLKLVNDDAAPGNSQYYGTDSGGTKGYFDFPSGGTITLTGDVTGSGSGSFSTTLANTAVTPGTYGNGTNTPQITVDSKGRITAAAEVLAPLIPVNTSSTAHQFFTAYSSVDGTFTKAQPAFSDLSGTPTTLSGYGITDAQSLDSDLTAIAALTTTSFGRGFLPLADAAATRTYIGAGTSSFSGAFSALSGIPTTLGGYGITDAQPLDSDLTTIAGLTATTDNFIVSVASAWASRTPAQVRTTLGLVIGTNVQAWDADLDTWAGITPGTGVATFLAAPTSANLAAAVTDENGSGKLQFSAGTLAITAAKTFTVNNSLTLAGTDGATITFPSTTATMARIDAAQTFIGVQTFAAGTAAAPTINFGTANTGFYAAGSGEVEVAVGGVWALSFGRDITSQIKLRSDGGYQWSSSTAVSGTNDTGLSRNAAGVVEINSGTAGTLRDLTLRNIISNTTGIKIATDVTHKLGFWNAAPIVQPSGANEAAVATTAATNVAPYGFAQAQADGIITLLNAIRQCLVDTGLWKGAA